MTKLDEALAAVDAPEALKEKSIGDLKVRLAVLSQVIKEAQRDGDKRWEKLISQQRRINEVLVAKIKLAREQHGIKQPESISIGMKPATLSAKPLSHGNKE